MMLVIYLTENLIIVKKVKDKKTYPQDDATRFCKYNDRADD